ncbi:hypothetical protein K2D_14050 [Planctomycetes bacterium K2D]|uniref:Uncharacterized protein n=2 Tax=Botrimarina mediterranea TaxID=2528022 RepID=A0A518K661_9BACT|nr:hypothetical protein Spa11_14790 [Botrimarina mediterranea]QDV77800.1 hypothetical protein K2D_14050 [Planctomycetes bacterium K2D]
MAIIAGVMIACSIVYELAVRHRTDDFHWMVMSKGFTVVMSYLTLGGCLLAAARKFWTKKMNSGLILAATGVLVMSLAVISVS